MLPKVLQNICIEYIGEEREQNLAKVHDEIVERLLKGTFLVSQLLQKHVEALLVPRFFAFKKLPDRNDVIFWI